MPGSSPEDICYVLIQLDKDYGILYKGAQHLGKAHAIA